MEILNPIEKENLLTVCLITYNHAVYIDKALKSIIEQSTNFYFNIIIADDCSTDGTADIIKKYVTQYPEKITAIVQNPNVGAGKNYDQLLTAAKGKYIAYLEGDDYWTDNTKLQQQVDILEANRNYVSCFTNVKEIFSEDENDSRNHLQNGCFPKSIIGFDELIYKNYIQTCSLVFRNGLATPLPGWLVKLKVGDWPLHILLSAHGQSVYIHKVMAVHRNHSSGLWSSKSKLARIEATLEAYDAISANTEMGKSAHFKKAKSNVLLSSVKYCFHEKAFAKAFLNFVKGFVLYPKNIIEPKIPA
jgi:glycosyltransferase involved in cell wall biosynthesis